jgi:hypothetical protein
MQIHGATCDTNRCVGDGTSFRFPSDSARYDNMYNFLYQLYIWRGITVTVPIKLDSRIVFPRSKNPRRRQHKTRNFNYNETDFTRFLPHFATYINIISESTINSKPLRFRWTFPLSLERSCFRREFDSKPMAR